MHHYASKIHFCQESVFHKYRYVAFSFGSAVGCFCILVFVLVRFCSYFAAFSEIIILLGCNIHVFYGVLEFVDIDEFPGCGILNKKALDKEFLILILTC